MTNFHLFEVLPIWAILIGILLVVLVPALLGIYLGSRKRRQQTDDDDEGPIGASVNATLGLLAFILAFTFSLTAQRYDTRKQLFLDEVTAIETTATHADLIPEPHKSEVRELIHKYIHLRMMEWPSKKEEVIERVRQSEEIQRQLWPHAAVLANADLKNADIVSLFIDSLNEMTNVQTRRVTIGMSHIPGLVWIILFVVTLLSMLEVGYLFGRAQHINWLFLIALSLAFAGVMILVADLDRSGAGAVGSITINQQPMIEMHRRVYGDHPK